jgi:hypothetical protein
VQPPVQPPPQAIVPPQALPPDQQQTYGLNDPTRMTARPYRPGGPQPGVGAPLAQDAMPPPAAARPPLPPGDIPAPTFNDRMAPAGPAAGPRAEGGDPRAAIAMAMLQQQGGPPENPTMPASGGSPDSGITDFSSQNRIPRAPAATPGYVPPEAADPTGVPPTPPSRREMELRTLLRQHQGNPYAAQSPAAVELQQLEAARARQDLEAQEIFKAKILRTTKLKELREQALMDQQKRIDEANAAEEALRKSRIPEVKKDIEEGHWFNPETNQWETPRMAGADPNKKPKFTGTEFQGKTMINYGRAAIAEEGLREKPKGSNETYEEILANSPISSVAGSIPVVGRALRSDAYKEADTHAENFVQSFIRQQSGAGFGVAELEAEARSMLPRYGDTKKQLETKREQREQFINGTYAVVGTSGQKGLDIDARTRAAAREKPNDTVLDFKSEADVAAARLKPGTRIRVNGRSATVQ